MTKLSVATRKKLIYDGVSSTDQYVGEASFNSATSEPVWRIIKLTYSGTDNKVLTLTYADGDDEFNNVWDDRASLSYS